MGQQLHESYLERRHFPGLNGVRCFAAIAVVWHHSVRPTALEIYEHGHMGVDVFFVLSGFLISTLLIREKEAFGSISLRNFWVRRALRLFPAYAALLGGMAALYIMLKPDDPDFANFKANIHVYALYLSNWSDRGVNNLGHTWTLATEEQFYLLWPMVEAFARPLALAAAWLAAVAINQGLNFGFLDEPLRSLGVMGERRLDIVEVTYTPILLGVALAHLLHSRRGYDLLLRLAGWRGAALTFVAAMIFILSFDWPNLDGWPRLTLHCLIALFFVALLVRPQSKTVQMLEWAPFVYLGTISYGIYLYHMLPTSFVGGIIGESKPWLTFPAAFAATIAIASVSYAVLEKPLLKLGTRFRRHVGAGSQSSEALFEVGEVPVSEGQAR
jgi:peptidoglycan/LPS O-acetylase OafA/YrhL